MDYLYCLSIKYVLRQLSCTYSSTAFESSSIPVIAPCIVNHRLEGLRLVREFIFVFLYGLLALFHVAEVNTHNWQNERPEVTVGLANSIFLPLNH